MMKGTASEVGVEQDVMASLLDQYMETNECHRGDVVEGVIASINDKTILIDIGGKADAIVHPREVERMMPRELNALKPGQGVSVYIIEQGDDDGTMLVSLARAAQQNDWDRARKLLRTEEPVPLPVVDTNKGGVIVRLGRLRGFVPGSQLLPTWRPQHNTNETENRWDTLLGETLTLRVIEVTPERNRLILSERRATDSKAVKRKILEKLQIGSVARGVVNNVVPFGAFVNVNGVDGLLHISELSWKRVTRPQEFVQVGQEIDVYILDVDLEQERLGLSLKRLVPDPWESVRDTYQEGQLVEATIVNLTAFGAFAALVHKPEIEGLIHISELADYQITRPQEVVKLGEQHTLKIISLQPAERRIAFSLKQARVELPNAPQPSAGEALHETPVETGQTEA
ncbi:MAG TPA: S1 RNA-binding domain-containing protein [Anaerolineae bacterium]|nr:S1 RNA-binding domain-containing protein [Anaerolineae bacterium]HQI84659.1 S1 RNA-binding domain-containing protein [Anaerolineae bacterium]